MGNGSMGKPGVSRSLRPSFDGMIIKPFSKSTNLHNIN
jgi:hypothetical protein